MFLCRTRGGIGPQLRVLAQGQAAPSLLLQLGGVWTNTHDAGYLVQWSTEYIEPGLLPGMATPELEQLTIHSFTPQRADSGNLIQRLRDAANRLSGDVLPGRLVSVWGIPHKVMMPLSYTFQLVPFLVQ